ncbi:MAG TPA: TetR/AcrR family transcriptional regulator [Candidatus Dormibacteraeota bacterium]|nr:TetR/AcrR family transcriptional regulator [Candidatus Dormibacteraeota bacterium]
MSRRILDRAPGVLARGGKPTVADFAHAAGVSRASFYRHFKSREALLEALDVTPEPGARDRILAAAVDLVGAQGLGALSMDELADRAEVSRATLYRVFPGKSALLVGLIHAYSPLDPVTDVLTSRSGEPPEVVMPELARTAFRATAGRTGVLRALFFEVSGLSPETEQVARDVVASTAGLLVIYLQSQMEAGRLRRIHPLLALQAFVGPVFFHILTRPLAERVLKLDIEGEAAVTQLAETWLRAMTTEEESGE